MKRKRLNNNKTNNGTNNNSDDKDHQDNKKPKIDAAHNQLFRQWKKSANFKTKSQLDSIFEFNDELYTSSRIVPTLLSNGSSANELHATLALKSTHQKTAAAATTTETEADSAHHEDSAVDAKHVVNDVDKHVNYMIALLDHLFETKTREKSRLDVRLESTKPTTTLEQQDALQYYKSFAKLDISKMLVDLSGAVHQMHHLTFQEPKLIRHMRREESELVKKMLSGESLYGAGVDSASGGGAAKGAAKDKHQLRQMCAIASEVSQLCISEAELLLKGITTDTNSSSSFDKNKEQGVKTLKDLLVQAK